MKTKQTRQAWAGFKTAEEGNAKLMQRPMVLALTVYCHWPIDIGLFALALLLAMQYQISGYMIGVVKRVSRTASAVKKEQTLESKQISLT